MLSDLGQESLEAIDKGVVGDVARRAGAGAVVTGSVFKSGAEFRLDVQVEDIESGRVLTAESARGADVFPLIDTLTRRIRAGLQVTVQAAGRPIAEVTTSSLDAYHAYTEALEARRQVRLTDASEKLERATEIDPGFALAHYELWTIAKLRGVPELAEHSRQELVAHLDRFPPGSARCSRHGSRRPRRPPGTPRR